MTSGEVVVFDDFFSYACLKFVVSGDGDNFEVYKM